MKTAQAKGPGLAPKSTQEKDPFRRMIVRAVERGRTPKAVQDVVEFVRGVGFAKASEQEVYHALIALVFEGPLTADFKTDASGHPRIRFGMKRRARA